MGSAPVSVSIIAVCVTLFVLGFISPATQAELIRRFASVNALIAQGEWWRIFTAAFLHGSLAHIFFNMYALYLFGPRLETQVGSLPFGLLYFASAAGGGAASYLLGPEVQVAVGASGAIFGLFGAWMVAAYKMRRSPAGRALFNQLAVLLAINLALPLLIPNIDWRAHLGGFATGLVVAALWGKLAVGRPNAETIRSVIAGTALAALAALVILG
jgi:membrane associated rhomboid family serine protease